MTILLVVLGMMMAFAGATGPAWMFLFPKLNPDLWYRLGLRRTVLLILGSLGVILAWLVGDAPAWPLILLPILIGLRIFMRPYNVIRALDAPCLLNVADAELPPDDYVLGVSIAGQSHAWPRKILIAHHLIHDTVAGNPLLACW